MPSNSEVHVAGLLASLGLHVEHVPEDADRRCDIRITSGSESYLLEVKDRGLPTEFEAHLRSEDLAILHENLCNTNRIDQLIRRAVAQVASTATSPTDYRLVWLVSRQPLRHDALQIILLKALLGLQELITGSTPGGFASVGCLYFTHSLFHRYRQLNALVFEGLGIRTLFVNELAPTHSGFLQGSLCRQFAAIGTVVEPTQLAADSGWIVAETEIDRANTAAMKQFVMSRFGLDRADPIDFTRCIATARLKPKGR